MARREGLQIPFPIQMQYRPFESPSPRQPGVVEVLDRFPRYRHVREAMLDALLEARAAAAAAGQPSPSPGATIVTYAAGEEIQARGAAVDRFSLVAEGLIDLFASDTDGAEVAVATLGPGDFHGDATISAGNPSEFRVVARTDVVEVVIDSRTMAGWLQGSSGLAAEIGDAIDQRRRSAHRLRAPSSGSARRAPK